MSGPKVICTVTIEQLRELALVQLALVEQAIMQWQNAAAANADSEKSLRERWINEQNRIKASLQSDRFDEVSARSQAIVTAIHHDIRRIQDEQDARNARLRMQERSLRQTAKSIFERSRREGLLIPALDREPLEAAAKGTDFDIQQVASIAARWFEETSKGALVSQTEAQETLARALSTEASDSSAAELLRRLEAEFADPRISTAERQLAELARLGEMQLLKPFELRLSKLESGQSGSNPSERSLAYDSLGLELSSAVKRARQRADLRSQLAAEVAAATATNDSSSCQPIIREAESAIESLDFEVAQERISQIRIIRESCQRSRAANAARKVVLSGLKQLGYEVREDMASTWAEKKRVSIRHPDSPGVALELAGNGDTGRMQTRMVAVEGATRDLRSDKQIEEEWCGNLQKLKDAVAHLGGSVKIEKALAAGQLPLKVIPDEWHDVAETTRRPKERERM